MMIPNKGKARRGSRDADEDAAAAAPETPRGADVGAAAPGQPLGIDFDA